MAGLRALPYSVTQGAPALPCSEPVLTLGVNHTFYCGPFSLAVTLKTYPAEGLLCMAAGGRRGMWTGQVSLRASLAWAPLGGAAETGQPGSAERLLGELGDSVRWGLGSGHEAGRGKV